MEFKSFEAAQTSIEPAEWQKRIIDEARAKYEVVIADLPEEEKTMALNEFDGLAREIVVKKKDDWTGKLAKSEDPENQESMLADGLLVAIKEKKSEMPETV